MDVGQWFDLRDVTTALLIGGGSYILRWAGRVNNELSTLHERANGADHRLDGLERKVYDGH